ncbi:MAG: hypothetical protein K8T20_16635, partial [Planctomycetes bacterium]|nr:hypothetical protein [Planctomycetota bacterium]
LFRMEMKVPFVSACLLFVCCAVGEAEVYLTADCGETWQDRGPKGFAVTQLVPDPRNPAVAWAIALPTEAKEGEDLKFASPAVLRTADAGKTWEALASWNGPDAFCIAVDSLNSDVVYVGATFGRIQKSADGGKTWRLISLKDLCRNPDGTPLEVQQNVLRICVRGERVLATVSNFGRSGLAVGGVAPGASGFALLSSDAGGKWTAIRREVMSSLALAGDRILLADDYGNAEESTDGGKTWTTIRKMKDHEMYPIQYHGTFSVSPAETEVVYCCRGRTISSTKAGEWTPWESSNKTIAAEIVAWCRPRRLAIFQHGTFEEGESTGFRLDSKRSLRVRDVTGEWVPIAVPGDRSPQFLMTACDGSAAWLIAK